MYNFGRYYVLGLRVYMLYVPSINNILLSYLVYVAYFVFVIAAVDNSLLPPASEHTIRHVAA